MGGRKEEVREEEAGGGRRGEGVEVRSRLQVGGRDLEPVEDSRNLRKDSSPGVSES